MSREIDSIDASCKFNGNLVACRYHNRAVQDHVHLFIIIVVGAKCYVTYVICINNVGSIENNSYQSTAAALGAYEILVIMLGESLVFGFRMSGIVAAGVKNRTVLGTGRLLGNDSLVPRVSNRRYLLSFGVTRVVPASIGYLTVALAVGSQSLDALIPRVSERRNILNSAGLAKRAALTGSGAAAVLLYLALDHSARTTEPVMCIVIIKSDLVSMLNYCKGRYDVALSKVGHEIAVLKHQISVFAEHVGKRTVSNVKRNSASSVQSDSTR